MKKLLTASVSSLIGVGVCVAFIYLSQILGISTNFPSPAGERDFSMRASYFFFGVCPAFLLLGAWIGVSGLPSTTKWLSMWAGAALGSLLAMIITHLLQAQIQALTADDDANHAVIIFYSLWIALSFLGALAAGRLHQLHANRLYR